MKNFVLFFFLILKFFLFQQSLIVNELKYIFNHFFVTYYVILLKTYLNVIF